MFIVFGVCPMFRFFVGLTVVLTALAYVEFGFLHAIVVCFFCGAWTLLWRLCWGVTRASAFEKSVGRGVSFSCSYFCSQSSHL